VTGKSEFALITVCDLATKKGQLAVIALTGCKPEFAHEWHKPYPGLPNVAMFAGMKLLGFVDLPGITAPTAVSATGNRGFDHLHMPDGSNGMLGQGDLDDQRLRQSFIDGNNLGMVSTAGWAVVAAAGEDKVVFIDLQPLFAYYHRMYFGDAASYAKTRELGPGDKQWPCTFAAEPAQKPVVVKTEKAPEPSAVLAGFGRDADARAWVACRAGEIGVYAVGGLADETPATADGIRGLERVKIGRNPCSLAYQRWDANEVLAVCRGDREVDWVRSDQGAVRVVRRLRDERLIDPVHCEVAETHGIQTGLITVCDFAGHQLINYRYSPVNFATNGGAVFGMGPDGKDEFECGGVLPLPGAPFAICAANVN
jgi:hypothetical protein